MTLQAGTHLRTHHHPVDLETALDFINTLELEDGAPADHLPTIGAALDWFASHGLIHERENQAPAPGPHAERELARVREARAAFRAIADTIVEGRSVQPSVLNVVNRLLRKRQVIELIDTGDGCQVGHRHVGDPVDDALARLAERLVEMVAEDDTERLRICDNDTCRWVFYDTSRTGRRRWCDMATCGNRAKAARHRARQREQAADRSA